MFKKLDADTSCTLDRGEAETLFKKIGQKKTTQELTAALRALVPAENTRYQRCVAGVSANRRLQHGIAERSFEQSALPNAPFLLSLFFFKTFESQFIDRLN